MHPLRIAVAVATAAFAVACVQGPEGAEGRPGITGAKGDKGDPGSSASPGITAVSPLYAAVGLTTQISISGTGTTWTDAASVSFGTGISVTRVRSPSPNALLVDIQVADDAAIDNRDITVSQGTGPTLAYRNAFHVVPLISVEAAGHPLRGTVASVVITHHDPAFEFDTSWSGTAFTGVTATTNPAGTVVVRDVKPHSVSLLVTVDTDAPLGKREVKLTNAWRRPSEVSFAFKDVFEVGDMNEQMLTATSMGTLTAGFDAALYKFTPTATSAELLASVTTTNGKGAPMLVLVPTTGHYSPMVSFVNSYSFTPYSTTQPYRFLVVDPNGTPGVDYAISVVTPGHTPEAEPNDGQMMAQAVTSLPQIVAGAQIGSATDVDFYKVTVTQAELGRALRVRSRAGDYGTDVRVDLLSSDGTEIMPGTDLSYHEDVRSPALTATGDYFVKISWGRYSTSMWSTYSSHYDLLLNWE